jgi:septal ring factor EnvC (AmiA/AmiB activator)
MIKTLKVFFRAIGLLFRIPSLIKKTSSENKALKIELKKLTEENDDLSTRLRNLSHKFLEVREKNIFLEEKLEIIKKQTTDTALELHKVLNIENRPGPLWITFSDERMLNERAFQMIKHTIEKAYPLVGPIIISPPLDFNNISREKLIELGLMK